MFSAGENWHRHPISEESGVPAGHISCSREAVAESTLTSNNIKLSVYAKNLPFPPIWLQNKASPLLVRLDALVLSGRAVVRCETFLTILLLEWQGYDWNIVLC